MPGSRVLHEAKEVTVGAPGREQPKQSLLYSSWLHTDVSSKFDPCSGLYNVLCPREGLLRGTTVLFTVQLGQLQHWHVAQGTHFADFQPLNKAPAEQDSQVEDISSRLRVRQESGVGSQPSCPYHPLTSQSFLSPTK